MVLAAVALAAQAASAAVAPPFNDGFGSAQLLTGETGVVAATSKDATKEAGEPAHAGNPGGASVWYRWVAPREGTVTFWITEHTFDTVLGVYSGASVDALTGLESNDDYGNGTASRVSLAVDAGAEYRIAVDGVAGASGPFRIRWRQGPENDNFADAQVLTDSAGAVEGSSYGTTTEPGETSDLSVASSWYRWTPSADGTVGFAVTGSARGLTVFTGSSVEALVPVTEAGRRVGFEAVAGTVYSIRVAGNNFSTIPLFTLHWGEAPANDDFSSPSAISGGTGRVDGSTVFATLEDGEPDHEPNSVWFSWTAPATGYVRFDSWQLEDPTWWNDTFLTVFSGTTLDTLTVLAQNDDRWEARLPAFGSAVSFRAVAGTTYLISVSAFDGSWGPFGLRWYPGAIIIGSSGNNRIDGTPGRDLIDGRAGSDVLNGLGGNDLIIGGPGRDRLFGAAGADFLNSQDFVRGNDAIDGGAGRDTARRDQRDTVRNVP
jgi:Ca2+-binding RTX toxin-like protein